MPSYLKTFFARQWFLIGLVLVLVTGCLATDALAWMRKAATLRGWIVAVVIFLTTLPVETAIIRSTLGRPVAPVLGTLMNFLVLPLIGWALSPMLSGDLALGLLVTAATPCTVASAAVWTRKAGGNDVVALMVTIITNASCFIVTALWLGVMTGQTVQAISPFAMIRKLALLVLLPMVLAQAIRLLPSVADWTRTHKRKLSTLAQIGILAIVLFGAVHCGLRLKGVDWTQDNLLSQFAIMIILCIVLHTTTLFLGQWIGRTLSLDRADWIAVGFAGSQKTLAVGLQVALMVGGGLVILPMVAYHFLQLFIDTLVANRLARPRMNTDEHRS